MEQKVGEPSINFWNVNKKGFEDEIGVWILEWCELQQ